MHTYNRHRDGHGQRGNAAGWIILLIALGIGAFFIFRNKQVATPPISEPTGQVSGAETSNQGTVYEGEVVCLPHRDTTGPTTMECAYGLKTDDGLYYGLDSSTLPADHPPEYNVGDRISVEGALVSQDQMPTNFWQTYNVTGLIAMQTFYKFVDK